MNIHKLNQKKTLVKGRLIVGLDLAKREHVAVLMLPDGVVVGKPIKVANEREAFELFWKRCVELRERHQLGGIIFAMEATGSYWEPLARYFRPLGAELVFVHAKVVKQSREMMDLSRSKNDPKDAYVIAQVASEGKFMSLNTPSGIWADLRELGLMRADVLKDWVAWGNRIRSLGEKFWPERERVLKSWTGMTSLHLLESCPFPDDALELGYDGLHQLVLEGSNRRKGRNLTKALLETAKVSIGVREGLETARWELKHCVELFRLLTAKLKEIDLKLVEAAEKTGYLDALASIPGLSLVGAALLLGEVGNPAQYRSAKEWIKLAGLNLIENQSGGRQKREGKRISRVGRPVLRHVLYYLSIPILRHNPEFRVHYLQLRKRGKPAMKAIVASMHKILRLTFALCRTGQRYQEPPDIRQRVAELKEEWTRQQAALKRAS